MFELSFAHLQPWLLKLWAAPAALGFALLFNVPPRSLIACCVLAVLGHVTRLVVTQCGGDIVLGTLIGAVAMGLGAEWWASRHRHIGTIYAISAAIPMVPGTYMYKAVQGLLQLSNLGAQANVEAILVDAGVNAVKGVMILMALAFGIAAPVLLWPQKND